MRPARSLLLLSFLFPVLIHGQANSPAVKDSLIYRYPYDVPVSASRISLPLKENPAATSVITASELKQMSKTIGVDEALKLVPGVRIDNQADGERVHMSIRGQGILTERGVRGIKVLLDGLPLNDPAGFAPDFYDVDWAAVEKIEVLRGPAAALYGGGSSGGVLNIITGSGKKDKFNGSLRTTIGSYNFWKQFIQAGGSSENVNYSFSASRMMGQGYREHTRYSASNFYGKAEWKPSQNITLLPVIGWTGFFNENAEGLNTGWMEQDRRMANPDALTFNEFQKTRRFTAGLSGRAVIDENQDISFNGFFRRTSYLEPVPSFVQHRTYNSPGGTLQYNHLCGNETVKNHASFGTDFQWQIIDEFRHPNTGGAREGNELLCDQSINQRGFGLFWLDRIEFGPKWGVMFSVRYDNIYNKLEDKLKTGGVDLSGDMTFSRLTGRLGLNYSFNPALNVYANWGQGFLPPAAEELINNPVQLGGGFNSLLSSATSMGEEVGLRGAVSGLFYDAAFFYLQTDKDFDRYRISTRPLETFYRNAGQSSRFGVETSFGYRISASLMLQTAYTYNNFKYTAPSAYDGKWLPNSPEHQLYADLSWAPVENLTLGLSSEVQSRWYVNPLNDASTGGFTLYHARAAWSIRISGIEGELSFAVRNIFNKAYIAFTEPDPDGNSYQPAAKREVFGGFRLGF